jgi:hypothetical protein
MARQQFHVLSAALIVLLAAGCGGRSSSVPHGGANAAGGVQGAHRAARDASSSAGGLFHPNSEKYSDAGAKPATGRSGSAQMQSRALFGKDGTTFVEATTGVLDGPPGPGYFRKMQAKLFAVDGSKESTQNYNHVSTGPYWSQTYTGMARNDTIQLQANVKGIDGNRNDVVSVTDTVKKRPDLAVRSVTGPAQAYVGTPVTFQAQVAELNGDVGANANCVLSVDGQLVDQAQAIWVDAGHTVSCLFQFTFATAGTHTVQVAATNVVPGDWDLSNNSAQTTIEIIQTNAILLGYEAGISSGLRNITYSDRFTGALSAYSNESTYSESTFSAYMFGYTYRQPIAFPVQQFSGSVTIDGVVKWQPSFNAVLAPPVTGGGQTCQSQYNDSAYGIACSFDSGYSFAEWLGSTGRVTYLSSHTDYTCSGGTCTQNNYISNTSGYTYGTGAPALDLGTTEQMSITVLDASNTTYTATTQPMTTTSNSNPYGSDTCYTYTSGTYCTGYHETNSSKRATGAGAGDGP